MEELNLADKIMETVKEELDTNGDGKIEMKEIIDYKRSIPVLLGVVISILSGTLITYIRDGLATGQWDSARMLDILSYLIPSIILLYIFKLVVNKIEENNKTIEDKRDKKIDDLILKLEKANDKIEELKAKNAELKQSSELKISQLESIIKTKDLEIDWLRNGYNPPGETDGQN